MVREYHQYNLQVCTNVNTHPIHASHSRVRISAHTSHSRVRISAHTFTQIQNLPPSKPGNRSAKRLRIKRIVMKRLASEKLQRIQGQHSIRTHTHFLFYLFTVQIHLSFSIIIQISVCVSLSLSLSTLPWFKYILVQRRESG